MKPATERFLASLSVTYLAASLLYVLASRCLGTPWLDVVEGLTDEQKKIREKAVRDRSAIFWSSLILSGSVVWIWSPFTKPGGATRSLLR